MSKRMRSMPSRDPARDEETGDFTSQLRVLAKRTTGAFQPSTDHLQTGTALLVCRDKSSQKWGSRWLRQAEIDVTILADGEDALAQARAIRPDVIVVEAWLADRNGEPLFRVFQDAADLEAPVFVLCSSTKEVSAALDAEVFDVARKPFDWQLLSRRTRLAISQVRQAGEIAEMRESLVSALDVANKARRKLRHTEAFEPITGLPNRAKFVELVARGMGAAARDQNHLAVFAIGFTRFQLVVEAMGRGHANHVITEIGNRLNGCVRKAVDNAGASMQGLRTAAVANIGVGRFAVMITCSADQDELVSLQQLLLEEMSRPAVVEGQTVYLSACVGAAGFPQDAEDADTLVLRSEAAMRDAQSRGGGFRFYCADIDAAASRRLKLEHMLHEAIERGELRLAYQPLTDIASDRIIGVEALLRWPQQGGGLINPDEFVPVAEDCGLMPRIGEFVLNEACRQLRVWHDAGLRHLRMCVNVSKCQLVTEDFPATVKRCIERYKLSPQAIDLELSERGVLSGNDDLLDRMLQLKRLGVTLSIDDFGTGDSAISYLKELPVNTLKIDRSYISGLTGEGRDSAITSAMIALGQKLNMTVVAEGVESLEQLLILKSLGCDQYQGFYRSPAVAPEAVVEFFRQS